MTTGRRIDQLDSLDFSLLYFRARFYDVANGCFLSRDPLGYADGENLYAFLGGMPLGPTDPTGRGPWWDFFQLCCHFSRLIAHGSADFLWWLWPSCTHAFADQCGKNCVNSGGKNNPCHMCDPCGFTWLIRYLPIPGVS